MLSEVRQGIVAAHWAFFAIFLLWSVVPLSFVRSLHGFIGIGDYHSFAPFLRFSGVALLFPLFWGLQTAAPKVTLGDFGYVLLITEYGLAVFLIFFLSDLASVRALAWRLQAAHLFFFSFFAESKHRLYAYALVANLSASLALFLIPVFLLMGLSD